MSKIALVDDDRNILTSVAMTLEAEGFEVETYNDGQAALDAFNKKLPDMAVLDIKMPRMDGMDLLQRLRQKTQMPVIFLTSKDDEIDEVLGLRMGADDYVKKPFSQRPGFVKSRDQLMDVAYDDQVYVDDRTIDSHIKRLRKKMRTADTDFAAIETLYGIGYRYNEE